MNINFRTQHLESTFSSEYLICVVSIYYRCGGVADVNAQPVFRRKSKFVPRTPAYRLIYEMTIGKRSGSTAEMRESVPPGEIGTCRCMVKRRIIYVNDSQQNFGSFVRPRGFYIVHSSDIKFSGATCCPRCLTKEKMKINGALAMKRLLFTSHVTSFTEILRREGNPLRIIVVMIFSSVW